MGSKTKTTSMRLGDEDAHRLDRIRKLRGRSVTNTEVVCEALAVYEAELERMRTTITPDVLQEFRKIAGEEIRSYMTKLREDFQSRNKLSRAQEARTAKEVFAALDFLGRKPKRKQ